MRGKIIIFGVFSQTGLGNRKRSKKFLVSKQKLNWLFLQLIWVGFGGIFW
jgi:hypothetical protein